MLDWVQSDMCDKVIESADIIKWIIRTPYLRYRNERLFLEAVADHNKKIWAAVAREKLDGFNRSQIELNRAVGFDSLEVSQAEFDTFNIEGFYNDK